MSAPFALEIVNLNKFFGGLPATNDVSMRVAPGERRLIIGPNGAGKTTLFNQIAGDFLPTSGSIRLFGQDVTRLRAQQRAHLGLSRTYQIITLFPKDTLAHNITLALLGLQKARWNMFRPLTFYPELMQRARHALDSVGLGALADRRVSELAYGEKRRAEIAMALAQEPRLLLLDEPAGGLGQQDIDWMKGLIRNIRGTTSVLIVEHHMDVVMSVCDRIYVLNFGELIAEGTPEQVRNNPAVIAAYLGTQADAL